MAEKGFVNQKEGRVGKEEMEVLARQGRVEKGSEAYADDFTEGPEEEAEEEAEEEVEEEVEEEAEAVLPVKKPKVSEAVKPMQDPSEQPATEESVKAIWQQGFLAGRRQAYLEIIARGME